MTAVHIKHCHMVINHQQQTNLANCATTKRINYYWQDAFMSPTQQHQNIQAKGEIKIK